MNTFLDWAFGKGRGGCALAGAMLVAGCLPVLVVSGGLGVLVFVGWLAGHL